MIRKEIIILLLISCNILFASGQERVNREKLCFKSVSGLLTKATGWAYNSTYGEWIDYENVISANKEYKDKYKILRGSWMMSKTSQNFLNMQIKTVVYKGVEYFVLVVNKWNGRYEYPAIYEDWYEYKETVGYIYPITEYQKLLSIDSIVELKTKYTVSIGSKYSKYDETEFLDLIQSELSVDESKYPIEYTFPIMKTKEGLIRFFVPDYYIDSSQYDFDKMYFETDLNNFNKLIIK